MSKLLHDPITRADIEEYLADYSDFTFELRVLKELTDLKLQCQHGGTYEDPVTGKSREFDIRALSTKTCRDESRRTVIRVHLSVECKNLRDNFPLVLHCLKRKKNESYNEFIYTSDPEKRYESGSMTAALESNVKSIRAAKLTLYPEGEYVAKSADQIGRRSDKTIVANDGGVFEKISQAINSARDLVSAANDLAADEKKEFLTFVCPVLVIPDSTLWRVSYSDDGARTGQPEPVGHVTYFIGKEWSVGANLQSLSYSISHLEILTFSEISNFVTQYLDGYINLIKDEVSWGGLPS
jgi:hypothetical protein